MPDAQTLVVLLLPTLLALVFVLIPRRGEPVPLRLRGVWLVLVVVAVTAIGDRLAAHWTSDQGAVNRVQSVLILMACCAFAWLNREARTLVRVAVVCLATGAGLNAAANLAYGGMPVYGPSGITAGFTAAQMAGPHPVVGYVLSDHRGWFAHYAGDFIPVPQGGIVLSIGDLLLWGGLTVLLATVFRSVAPQRKATRHRPEEPVDSSDSAAID